MVFLCPELDASFTGATIIGWLPIGTKRRALQQIAFALGAVVDPTRSATLRLYPWPTAPPISIPPARKILGHTVKLEELVTQVDITTHKYNRSAATSELAKETLAAGQHTITFSGPSSVTAVTGATLVTSHVNYCVVNVASAGEVVVTGYTYDDATIVLSAVMDPLPNSAKQSVKAVTDAALIHSGNAAAAALRVYAYYQARYTDEGRLLPGDEAAGACASLASLGGVALVGSLERVVTDLYGGCLETIKIRGSKSA